MENSKKALKFILKKGLLQWGLSTAFLFTLFFPILYWLINKMLGEPTSYWSILGNTAYLAFIFFPVGGIIWGTIIWRFYKIKSKTA